jgi:DNA modification methylase
VSGRAIVLRGDAAALPLPDESVDLIVTSPPYFGLRSWGHQCGGPLGTENARPWAAGAFTQPSLFEAEAS